MSEVIVNCGGCTACCEWKGDKTLAPPLTMMEAAGFETMVVDGEVRLKMGSSGNCIYLHKGKCSIWKKRPLYCQEYDCRTVLAEVIDNPLIRTCLAASLLNMGLTPGKEGFKYEPNISILIKD